MTEAEWLACTDPTAMLEFLRGKASERKLRLFAAAGFARLVGLLPDPRQRRGIEVLEQLAEGDATPSARRSVTTQVRQAIPRNDWGADPLPTDDPHYVALMLYREFCSSSPARHAVHATAGLADAAGEQRQQARLMGCIFGNPFRPSLPLPPAVLNWSDSTLRRIAQSIYEERRLPVGTLDNSRLAILADALLDAGCEDEALMQHCREPGPHVRGCWAVDLILGRE